MKIVVASDHHGGRGGRAPASFNGTSAQAPGALAGGAGDGLCHSVAEKARRGGYRGHAVVSAAENQAVFRQGRAAGRPTAVLRGAGAPGHGGQRENGEKAIEGYFFRAVRGRINGLRLDGRPPVSPGKESAGYPGAQKGECAAALRRGADGRRQPHHPVH